MVLFGPLVRKARSYRKLVALAIILTLLGLFLPAPASTLPSDPQEVIFIGKDPSDVPPKGENSIKVHSDIPTHLLPSVSESKKKGVSEINTDADLTSSAKTRDNLNEKVYKLSTPSYPLNQQDLELKEGASALVDSLIASEELEDNLEGQASSSKSSKVAVLDVDDGFASKGEKYPPGGPSEDPMELKSTSDTKQISVWALEKAQKDGVKAKVANTHDISLSPKDEHNKESVTNTNDANNHDILPSPKDEHFLGSVTTKFENSHVESMDESRISAFNPHLTDPNSDVQDKAAKTTGELSSDANIQIFEIKTMTTRAKNKGKPVSISITDSISAAQEGEIPRARLDSTVAKGQQSDVGNIEGNNRGIA